jgi:hypothetical protein
MISHAARHKTIQSEFVPIRYKIGGAPYRLPKFNSSQRTSYKDYYDPELQQMGLDHYEKDFDLWGYDRNYNPGFLFHLFEKTI